MIRIDNRQLRRDVERLARQMKVAPTILRKEITGPAMVAAARVGEKALRASRSGPRRRTGRYRRSIGVTPWGSKNEKGVWERDTSARLYIGAPYAGYLETRRTRQRRRPGRRSPGRPCVFNTLRRNYRRMHTAALRDAKKRFPRMIRRLRRVR